MQGFLIKEGLLVKQGHFIKNWLERWFGVARDRIEYRIGSRKGQLRGTIPLASVTNVKVIADEKSPGLFVIYTDYEKTFYIRAKSDRDADAWVSAIRSAKMAPGPAAALMREASLMERTGNISARERMRIDKLLVAGSVSTATSRLATAGSLTAKTVYQTRSGSAESFGSQPIAPPSPSIGPTEARFHDLYRVGVPLGRGSLGQVHQAVQIETGKLFAVKIVSKSADDRIDRKWVRREAEVMQVLQHPNIVRLEEFFDEEDDLYLVLELMEGGELFDYIVAQKQFSEQQARDVVQAVASALHHIHSKGYVHRDLKPENILISSRDGAREYKLADFGYARRVNMASGLKTSCGTRSYIAPELLEGTPYMDKVDMWSLGVVTYIMLSGSQPFRSRNPATLYSRIKAAEVKFPAGSWSMVSEEAKDLVVSLLCKDPEKRLSAKQVLEHPWMRATVVAKLPVAARLQEYNRLQRETLTAGWLEAEMLRFPLWKRRWVVLRSSGIHMYTRTDEEDEVEHIPARHIVSVKLYQPPLEKFDSIPDVVIPLEKPEPAVTVFHINTVQGRTYNLEASTPDEAKRWVAVLTVAQHRSQLIYKAQTAWDDAEVAEMARLVHMADEWSARLKEKLDTETESQRVKDVEERSLAWASLPENNPYLAKYMERRSSRRADDPDPTEAGGVEEQKSGDGEGGAAAGGSGSGSGSGSGGSDGSDGSSDDDSDSDSGFLSDPDSGSDSDSGFISELSDVV